MLLFPSAQGVRVLLNYWIRIWQTDSLKLGPGNDMTYAGYYALLFLVFFAVLITRSRLWFFHAVKAATRLHDRFLAVLASAPMSFYSQEPLGAILKAYSKDGDQVDDSLPDSGHMAFLYLFVCLGILVSLIISLEIFALLSFVLISIWVFLQKWSSGPVYSCKNSVSWTDSQAVVQISESLHGISVVRAFQMQENMLAECAICMDAFGSALFHMDHISIWNAAIFDAIATIFVFLTAIICVAYRAEFDAPLVGVVMADVTQLLVFLVVNAFNDFGYKIFSVGRIQHYIENVPSENYAKSVNMCRDARDRPMFLNGNVQFQKTDMKYDPNSSPVLKGLSFSIKQGERIGIVGITGSGKSATVNAMFRLNETCAGSIHIGDLKIQDLFIKDLRRSISIIPQEPIVFRGTVRSNLDPFNQSTESELLEALRDAGMLDVVMQLPGGLDAELSEGGGNLSVGQRQLLCLARVCLRKDRLILVLDEATSALDPATDQVVQTALRRVFGRHTVLTIAHRLDTIIDYVRIMVLDSGKLVECDSAENLLNKPAGIFKQMYEGASE
jgi:ABC-type multidrug transport system fused ATPase/permease subunit